MKVISILDKDPPCCHKGTCPPWPLPRTPTAADQMWTVLTVLTFQSRIYAMMLVTDSKATPVERPALDPFSNQWYPLHGLQTITSRLPNDFHCAPFWCHLVLKHSSQNGRISINRFHCHRRGSHSEAYLVLGRQCLLPQGWQSFTYFLPYRIHVVAICISLTKDLKKRQYDVTVPYAKKC